MNRLEKDGLNTSSLSDKVVQEWKAYRSNAQALRSQEASGIVQLFNALTAELVAPIIYLNERQNGDSPKTVIERNSRK